jgi:hypothetical protein
MACSRVIHDNLMKEHPEHIGQPYRDEPPMPSKEGDISLAAMPAWQTPKWAARVRAAVGEAEREVDRLTDACDRSGYHFLTSDRLRREKAKLAALQTIALWGDYPLHLEEIEAAASAVTTDGITVPA